MSKPVVIGVVLILFVVAGAGVVWVVVFDGLRGLTSEPAPRIDYSHLAEADRIVQQEYVRFKGIRASGDSYDLHPAAQAIVDDMDTITTVNEFRLRVTRALFTILEQQASEFRDAHPEFFPSRPANVSEDNREYDTPDDAALPYALGTEQQIDRIEKCAFVRHLLDRAGEEFMIKRALPLKQGDLHGREQEVDEFLELSSGIADRLDSALGKKRIYLPHPGNYSPETLIALPTPINWGGVLYLRVLLQLHFNELASAREMAFAYLEFLERADMSRSTIGAVARIVHVDQYIEHVVNPCFRAGALSADDLDEIYRRGVDIGVDFGYMGLEGGLYDILQFLGSIWTRKPETGSGGLPKSMVEQFGKVGIDEWIERLETERPERIAVFESELDAMRSGKYVIRTEEDYRTCSAWGARVLDPLIHGEVQTTAADAYLSQVRWLEVKIRAEEKRRGKSLADWPASENPLRGVPGIKVERRGEYFDVYSDDEYFARHGKPLGRTKPEFRVHAGSGE
ncbi:MAG: hypothetical protein K8I27_10985 [Planctomycetes bacterium]|nr:hypothetical protein [Planctomycetota bacterium]